MADMGTKAEQHKPRRRNKDTLKAVELAARGDVDAAEDSAPDRPWMEPHEDWEPEIRFVFEAMKQDVMAQFMTPTSWALLYMKCSAWDKEFKPKFLGISNEGTVKKGRAPVPGAVLADMQKTMDSFGASERARREMKILIDPDPDASKAASAGDSRMAAKKAIARPARKALGA